MKKSFLNRVIIFLVLLATIFTVPSSIVLADNEYYEKNSRLFEQDAFGNQPQTRLNVNLATTLDNVSYKHVWKENNLLIANLKIFNSTNYELYYLVVDKNGKIYSGTARTNIVSTIYGIPSGGYDVHFMGSFPQKLTYYVNLSDW